jgi:MFS family permease
MTTRDKITLGLLVAMSFFLMADIYITPGIVNDLAGEFGVPVSRIGFIGSAFVLVGAVISIVFGYLTDKLSRKRLLVATVLIGEIPCLLTGIHWFTPTLGAFLVMRVLTGIGIGGIYPLTFSLVSDYFRARHRAKACACVEVAWGLGMMVGPALAAFAVTTGYGWRLAFVMAALPNFPAALMFAAYARDPQRGRSEELLARALEDGEVIQRTIRLRDFKIIFSSRTNLLLFSQGIPGCIPWGLLPFWLIAFFETARGYPKAQAAMVWEIFGIGATIGLVGWAVAGDRLFQKKPAYLPMLCGIGVVAGMIPCYAIVNLPISLVPETTPYLLYGLALTAGLGISVASANVKAMLMNVNRPEHRGSVFAVFNLADSIGKGIGPALGGMLMGFGYFVMMNVAISFWLICGLIMLAVMVVIGKDRQALLDLMARRAGEGVP